ncbi:hypothetical protein CHGG_08017 [Chaetomium globosum CBS 148.51]|uniref:Uncharacterized protein n=1 Tax=Chaetomium globosum (strain ATCC 6205 / CBS 148.51 / DSM 1962 / NBRC 6347 / NRRL 1970) TaxID=306901 RepID=Q2GVI7_CHAGB|nr:uncharacterized protein CHGG_08017 [Chaetomium globosum CBS 148.51]EAQ86764.1 hypothetical protein CHGG_08017 [Chaetomium globosum CBS 148.51]
MAKKARQRISYVLEAPNSSPGGHRLGVNGLAVDRDNAILYSGGRDGVICAWDLNNNTQAHTHWINDIALAQKYSTTGCRPPQTSWSRPWRPLASDVLEPVTIGQHADYVKCVATPSQSTPWVASGGLDRKISLWDLSGAGQTLEIDVRGEEVEQKGSVYALGVTHNILANGGPESIVRLWDPRSGQRITKFVGHTDTIRAILISESGDMVLSASSDQTVKVWSVAAGRCMHTLTMHDHSVWALFSDDPGLDIFYSSDRSGLVVKTDVCDTGGDMDKGLSVAVAKENDGVSKMVTWDDSIWTATATASINRWKDVDTSASVRFSEAPKQHRASLVTVQSKDTVAVVAPPSDSTGPTIPAKSILRISNTAPFQLVIGRDDEVSLPGLTRSVSELTEHAVSIVEPIHHVPEETIEGQFGLVKHRLLNDRRRVLTLDTAGDVLMWDLIQCRPVKSFGKRHLEDVEPEVNTREAVAPWCSIDIINLGKWVLRYLFANLIDEEIRRDETFRQKINQGATKRIAAGRTAPSLAISIPSNPGWGPADLSSATPRAHGSQYPPMTPGFGIGLATPGSPGPPAFEGFTSPLSPLVDKRSSQVSRPSQDREDYFSDAIQSPDGAPKPAQTPATEAPPAEEKAAKTPGENGGKEKDAKDKDKEKDKENGKPAATMFSKKFRMNMSFGTKKLGRSLSTTTAEKPAVLDERAEESESSSNHEKEFDDNFLGVVQKMHNDYEKQQAENPDQIVESKITPSLANDTPVLKLPAGTKVIIQEETSGGSAEMYRGTVASVGADADVIEKRAPQWLGDVLLLNTLPPKDPVKISFVLHPWKETLPPIVSTDGNNRLNANRMLRVKKILAYVAERIDPVPEGEEPAPDALKPEEYLELYCNDQLLPLKMTLATLRTHAWRGGNDIVLHYKANGRKEIPMPPPVEVEVATDESEAAAPAA